MKFSFIDYGNKDFLHDEDGKVIVIDCADNHEAESWLMDNHAKTDWTNVGTAIHCWDD